MRGRLLPGRVVGLPCMAETRGAGDHGPPYPPETALAIAAALGDADLVLQMRRDAQILQVVSVTLYADKVEDDEVEPFACQRAIHVAATAAVVDALCNRVESSTWPRTGLALEELRDGEPTIPSWLDQDDGCWGQADRARAKIGGAVCEVGPRAVLGLDRSGRTPLHCARSGEVALALLVHGASPRGCCSGVVVEVDHGDGGWTETRSGGEWKTAIDYLDQRGSRVQKFEPEAAHRWRTRRTVESAHQAVLEHDRWAAVPIVLRSTPPSHSACLHTCYR